jgi:hypothetical protein
MKKLFIKWMSNKKWAYQLSIKLIALRIVNSKTPLTKEYLILKGWILEDGIFWVEKEVKERDKIRIQFESHYYRVWHGENKTFIALESSLEWFENYYLLIHSDNGRYKLAGI